MKTKSMKTEYRPSGRVAKPTKPAEAEGKLTLDDIDPFERELFETVMMLTLGKVDMSKMLREVAYLICMGEINFRTVALAYSNDPAKAQRGRAERKRMDKLLKGYRKFDAYNFGDRKTQRTEKLPLGQTPKLNEPTEDRAKYLYRSECDPSLWRVFKTAEMLTGGQDGMISQKMVREVDYLICMGEINFRTIALASSNDPAKAQRGRAERKRMDKMLKGYRKFDTIIFGDRERL